MQAKTAIVKSNGKTFNLFSVKNHKVVYSKELSAPVYWEYSEDTVRIADFSSFQVPGEYLMAVGDRRSHPFTISSHLYDDVSKAAMKSFYYMRASTPLPEKYAGKWARSGGHSDDVVFIHETAGDSARPAGSVISSPGGWYDAGDYNKYIVNSGITTYTLLSLWETFPQAMGRLALNIPESENKVPDLLDEIRWNLKWMMTMQDPNDGGVYHKLTDKNFSDFKMPSELQTERYVAQKSTGAALNFSATLAVAARIYSDYNTEFPGFADSCLAQAKYAFEWTKKNPNVFFKNPPDIVTGEYGSRGLEDELIWASVELFIATNDVDYLFDLDIYAYEFGIPTWSWTPPLTYMSILNNKQTASKWIDMQRIEDKLKDMADVLHERYIRSAYRTTINDFKWGSNAHVLNQALVLALGYHYLGDPKYFDAALSNMDYLFGKNPLGKSYVTGFGSDAPTNPHFRITAADGIEEPIPGFVVGGPQTHAVHDCGAEKYPSLHPAKCYIDDICSYSTNEIAINWNAPLAFVAGSIGAILNKKTEAIDQRQRQ